MAKSPKPEKERLTEQPLLPREPNTEKAQQSREQYLGLARVALKKEFANYHALFQTYAGNDDSHNVQQLDQTVARVALQAGHSPRQVIQFIAQGPFVQFETRLHSPEENKAALPNLLHYAKTQVEAAQQLRYTEYANEATGIIQGYGELYREYISSDLVAIQLDQKVVAAALRAGESAEAVVHLLYQGPYARFQQGVKGMDADALEQYAKGTVAQVQAIQVVPVLGEGATGRAGMVRDE
ncbi:MAG: hypothetical protein F6K11_32235 [Leptolyngbya sp. SIO3F4]|nr:hypothetical protein [Leptolyngbya sp. SIO3F4]